MEAFLDEIFKLITNRLICLDEHDKLNRFSWQLAICGKTHSIF